MFRKYLKSYLQYVSRNLIAGQSSDQWEKEQALCNQIPITNTSLAHELEQACQKKGYLSFAEYMEIDQCGQYGYHATHKIHGLQPVKKAQVSELLTFCIQNNIRHVIDFGCGTGELGSALVQAAQQQQYELFWSGIEINTNLHANIRNQFQRKRLGKYLRSVASEIQTDKDGSPTMLLFSYSLDSIPPELCTNTRSIPGPANAMIGIRVENNKATESLLQQKQLEEKRIISKETSLMYQGSPYNIQKLALAPSQHAYIPFGAINLLVRAINMYQASSVVILDEFRLPQVSDLREIGIPFELHRYGHTKIPREQIYLESGENLYYYPLYKAMIENVLTAYGFAVSTQIEPLFAEILSGRSMYNGQRINTCGTMYATRKKTKSPTNKHPIPIELFASPVVDNLV